MQGRGGGVGGGGVIAGGDRRRRRRRLHHGEVSIVQKSNSIPTISKIRRDNFFPDMITELKNKVKSVVTEISIRESEGYIDQQYGSPRYVAILMT